jgi:two-component system, chemotaxis family, protein-glutamate methylesterase/glutaminase
MTSSSIVRVLVVDDSAYVRKVVTQMLLRSPFIEVVGTARDGRDALERVDELQPDVVTCDLIMPELDGVAFVREQMARHPVPIVIVSVASESGELVLNALDAGAVDFIQKPTALASDRLLEMAEDLIGKVKAAASSHVRPVRIAPAISTSMGALVTRGAFDIVVIGISTSGPQALRAVIPRLPAELPVPVAIVLHMPVGYTELYAQKLNELSPLTVREAEEGLILNKGMVLIAPAGRHLTIRRNGAGVRAHLDVKPLDAPYRPSVDVLFQSAADVYGSRVLGVVMTGMGSDGRDGAAWIKAKGGTVITESEDSCVVYGMPRSIEEAGLSDRSISLDGIADAILGYL